jgi:hypothetical protein
MSTPSSPAANGRARKSLEHQLDRFDSILDGLANALNESVADAVKDSVGQAVREAVQVVVAELVANPQVAKALAAAHGINTPAPTPTTEQPVAPPKPKGPGLRERLAARWRRLRSGITAVTGRMEGRLEPAEHDVDGPDDGGSAGPVPPAGSDRGGGGGGAGGGRHPPVRADRLRHR